MTTSVGRFGYWKGGDQGGRPLFDFATGHDPLKWNQTFGADVTPTAVSDYREVGAGQMALTVARRAKRSAAPKVTPLGAPLWRVRTIVGSDINGSDVNGSDH